LNTERRLGPELEFRLQCCSGLGDYGEHPAHGARWLPLVVLAQQGAEAANLVIIEKLAGIPRREPFAGDNDRARHAQSDAASSASPNHRSYEHDARWRITQNHAAWEYGRDRDNFRNIIEDWRCHRLRTPFPPRQSLAEDVAPVGKVDFVLWRDHSDKSGGQTSSRLATSTGIMALATRKNSFRCIRP
jgi:hypothetical protein